MKKLVPMAVAAVFVATVAFASIRQPSAVVSNQQTAVVDTVIPQDTTITPQPEDTSTVDTTSTVIDTSSVE